MPWPSNFSAGFAGLVLVGASGSSLWAGLVTDQMRDTIEQVVAVVQDPRLKSSASQSQRRERLRLVLGARFDFAEMAKRSLGPTWHRRTADEQREFVRLFTNLLEKSYADQIESLQGEKVVFTRERLDQNYAELDSKIVTPKREEYSVNYKLLAVNGEWKVYDVIFSDVSLVNNYRSQFNRVLAKASFDELLRGMREGALAVPGK